ncbi:hypothetical protein ACHQM5_010597 [Ranunculus cassubicifolius]
MESQLLAHFLICMMVVLMVLCPIKVVQTLSSNGYYGGTFCSQRYLSKSYFEIHDRLVDSDFEYFLPHKNPLCSCDVFSHNSNFIPKLSVVQRRLIGEGSHRHLSTFIKFHNNADSTLELPAHSCQAVIIEKLPSGVFADPYELQHLVQRGVFVDAGVFGDTNLELPSALSNRSVVEVHLDIKGVEMNLDLPLHARYPPLHTSSYSNVEMGVPDILVRCVAAEKEENCSWIARVEIGQSANTSHSAMWRIPCGNKAHSELVSALTFISAVLSALFVVLSAICYTPSFYFTSNSKQS